MITIVKEAISTKDDGTPIKRIAMDIDWDKFSEIRQKKNFEAVFGSEVLNSIEKHEASNDFFKTEYVDENGVLCWKNCNNIRGRAYTAKELTDKIVGPKKND